MSIEEAKKYVDSVVEYLYNCGKLSEQAYGTMTENQREAMAEKIKELSEE